MHHVPGDRSLQPSGLLGLAIEKNGHLQHHNAQAHHSVMMAMGRWPCLCFCMGCLGLVEHAPLDMHSSAQRMRERALVHVSPHTRYICSCTPPLISEKLPTMGLLHCLSYAAQLMRGLLGPAGSSTSLTGIMLGFHISCTACQTAEQCR